ncbi:MAG: uncharacterized protein JWQ98_2368 [Chlorobi bacterium]|nr:uncharacterized protein [Chlorobiota bacterium]
MWEVPTHPPIAVIKFMNTNGSNTPDNPADQPELYALNALSPMEAAAFEARIINGDVDAEELENHMETMLALCEEMASVMPAPRRALKDAVMAAIDPAPAPGALKPGEQVFVMADEGEWQNPGLPGFSMKILYHDDARKRTTVLVRLAPGTAYPAHRHMGLEECMVLEGDLYVDGHSLQAGDYTASMTDKIHIDTHSEHGCLLLLNTPLDDEFLEDGYGA